MLNFLNLAWFAFEVFMSRRLGDLTAILLAGRLVFRSAQKRNSVQKLPSPSVPVPGVEFTDYDKQFEPKLSASKVPSTRIGRIFEFGTLGLGVGVGILEESIKR